MVKLRGENNILIAKIDDAVVSRMFVGGKFVEKDFKDTGKTRCYVYNNDFSLSLGHMDFFIWRGYYLQLEGN